MNSAIVSILVLLSSSAAGDDSTGKISTNHSLLLTPAYSSAALPPPPHSAAQDQITNAPAPAVKAPQPHRLTPAAVKVATEAHRSGGQATGIAKLKRLPYFSGYAPTGLAKYSETDPITSPPKPTTAKPVPEAGRWMVTDDETGLVCIMIELKAELNIEYETSSESKVSTATIHIPPTATAKGSCGNTRQAIAISWKDHDASRSLSLEFQLVNMTEPSYIISKLEFKIQENASQFPNASKLGNLVVDAVNSTNFFELKQGYFYFCDAARDLSLYYIASQSTYNATVSFSDMKLEAFRTKTDVSFGKPTVCAADASATNDVVPIAVGCALAALVVIVVIAYLISRKKVRSEYQAM